MGCARFAWPISPCRSQHCPGASDLPALLAPPDAAPTQGLLLVGMSQADCCAVQAWFERMEPGFVVSPCPAGLLAAGTLLEAVGGAADAAALPARPWEAPPPEAPPVAFFSGLSGEEQVALMEGWGEHTGLEAPAFASGKAPGLAAGHRAGHKRQDARLAAPCALPMCTQRPPACQAIAVLGGAPCCSPAPLPPPPPAPPRPPRRSDPSHPGQAAEPPAVRHSAGAGAAAAAGARPRGRG